MLAEIFMLRLEAAARVTAHEAPKYSPRTGAERTTSEAEAFTEYPAPAVSSDVPASPRPAVPGSEGGP
jgi:hypothetical protein